ncbi:MAG TPA: hypothetical protein EYQ78_05930, partial [Candidatus Poseidoniales archaeon]|nr:hypothetical protein [Candidatus Poseidoniales archaeon]
MEPSESISQGMSGYPPPAGDSAVIHWIPNGRSEIGSRGILDDADTENERSGIIIIPTIISAANLLVGNFV